MQNRNFEWEQKNNEDWKEGGEVKRETSLVKKCTWNQEVGFGYSY